MSIARHLFEPIAHESVADAVIEQIENLIVSGVLKQGRKLPPEREMAEWLGVSRPKLREALKRLDARKLIRAHQGGGTFVAPLIGEALSPALTDLYARHPGAFFDYLEYRRNQECFAARLAAQRATEADRQILKKLLNKLQHTHDRQDKHGLREADIAFHAAVADASHNSMLVHMLGSIYALTRRGVFYNRDYLRTLEGGRDTLLQQHLNIGDSIINGDAERAEMAAAEHLDFVERSFKAWHEQHKREQLAAKRLHLTGLKDDPALMPDLEARP